ncbi:MAG TPA: thiamine-phosphate kinase [Candidatus Sulfotelmatobacter sp.]|nr:thiamine-phosphate kinase [Candidatus Sulfotelmatobacter sp.]
MPLAEKALIAEIRRVAAGAGLKSGYGSTRLIPTGIGDDCAVLHLPASRDLLVTTDFSLEGVHFRREWHAPEVVGRRCLVRGMSDIAAMGGEPVACFLSLALPHDLPQAWVRGFMRGLMGLAKKYEIVLAGGDTAQSPAGILADIVVVGAVPKGKAILRSRARPGDRIYVSGELGGSAAAVVELMRHPKKRLHSRSYPRHFRPKPRIELGHVLREKRLASAMIDTSDGLSTDLSHICEESGVGAELDATLIPRARVGRPLREVDLGLALHGGEDYELLFTVPRGKRIPPRMDGVRLTEIGRITRGRKILLCGEDGTAQELRARGWEHLRE